MENMTMNTEESLLDPWPLSAEREDPPRPDVVPPVRTIVLDREPKVDALVVDGGIGASW